jgi:glycosyl-4,4'-diaponeurosporenoate acyltransferase
MQIIFLSDIGTVIMDICAWVFFHLSIGFWCSRIPVSFFNTKKPFYITKKWENEGEIYQKLFRVKSWKKYIPSGGSLYTNTFKIKNLPCYSKEYLERWLKESCRAELCHWIMILPGFLFFLWNNVKVAWLMVAYAVLNNMVPIIMQRYNRPRISKLLKQIQSKSADAIASKRITSLVPHRG